MRTPIGTVVCYAGAAAPSGWLLCNGDAVSRTTYASLYSAIGTTFGPGNGTTTFNVPDARGRATVGVGTGAGLTARTLAATGGAETHALSEAELASHDHDFLPTAPTVALVKTVATGIGFVYSDAETLSQENATATQNAGSGTAHANMQPFLALNFLIYAGTEAGLGLLIT